MEFPAWECRLKNYVSIALEHKWYYMNVTVDRHNEHPLPSSFRMLDDIQVLFFQDQRGDFIKRDSSFDLQLGALFVIPDYVHGGKISHYVYNVNCLFAVNGPPTLPLRLVNVLANRYVRFYSAWLL